MQESTAAPAGPAHGRATLRYPPSRQNRKSTGPRVCDPQHTDPIAVSGTTQRVAPAKPLRLTEPRSGARVCDPQHTGPIAVSGTIQRVAPAKPLRLTEPRSGA